MSLPGTVAGGGISQGPITLASIIPSGPMSANIWFADGYGTWFGTGNGTTQPDSTLTWDDANQWVQLAVPGAGGTGLAEFRWRGDFSRAGAADTVYLNQSLPGVLALTGGVAQTKAALYGFSATAISNAAAPATTVTDLYTVYAEVPTGDGVVTRAWSFGAAGGVQVAAGSNLEANRHTSAAQTIAGAGALVGVSFTPGAPTLSSGSTISSFAHYSFANTQVVNAGATITEIYTVFFDSPTASGALTDIYAIGVPYLSSGGGIGFQSQTPTDHPATIRSSYYGATTLRSLQLRGPAIAGAYAEFFLQANGWTNFRGTGSGGLQLNSNVEFGWGAQPTYSTIPVTVIDWSTPQTNDGLVWGMATTNMSLLFVAYANRENNYAAAAATNPTVYVYSATAAATATDEWISLSHNVTDGVISVGSGNVLIGGTASFAVAATARVYLDGGGNTSIRESAADTLQFETGGTDRLALSTTSLTGTLPMRLPGGSVGVPSYAFTSTVGNDNGLYGIGADNWACSAGGVKILEFLNDGALKMGFFALATPVIKQTVAGVKVDPVAASILAALVAYGFVTDTTT